MTCFSIPPYSPRLFPSFPGGRAAVSAAGVPDDPLVHEEHAVREPRHHGSPGRHPGKTSIVLVLASLDQLTPALKDQFILVWVYTYAQAFTVPELPAAPQDGIVHPTDTSLRDFSAVCVREFLTWSIKQTTKKVCAPYVHTID